MKRFLRNIVDSYRPVELEVLACYQQKLPPSLDVLVHKKEKGGYWAEIEGVGVTQASSREELEEMVNDAVATFYEIPYRYAKRLLISKLYRDPELEKKRRKAYRTA